MTDIVSESTIITRHHDVIILVLVINDIISLIIIDDHVVWGATAIMIHEFNLLFKHVINS